MPKKSELNMALLKLEEKLKYQIVSLNSKLLHRLKSEASPA